MRYPKYHIGIIRKVYLERTPISYRIRNFLSAGKNGSWIRYRERERLGYKKCYS